MKFRPSTKRSSTLALAFALAAGTVFTGAVFETPAQAQKQEKAAKADYSKGFIAAYTPVNENVSGEAPDYAAAAAAAPGLVAAAETADDRHAAGSIIYSVGAKSSNDQLMVQGLELMLASGKVAPEQVGQFHWSAYQLNQRLGNTAAARAGLEGAIAANYTLDAQLTDGSTRQLGADDMHRMVSDLYFDAEDYPAGFAYLDEQIAARQAAGQTVPEAWVKHGFVTAYNNDMAEQARKYSLLYVQEHPTKTSWGDAIAVALNGSRFEYPEILDILRLSRRTDTFRDGSMYTEYIEAADPRKFPGEVLAVIDEGYASGMLDRSDPYVTESRAEAERRVEADKNDLPELLADARAGNANLVTVMAAGDTFLSYGRAAEAEEFYTRALDMPGVNTPMVLTRLGIAQLDQGKHAQAEATFNRVDGPREPIANLWAIYTTQQNAGG
ncbi:MAG: hypothetical protein KKH37_08630 [Alphaproteobacteria bacterium]|nr:hypothetical protein [Alphaproteobacteria bacterium]MBU2033815.1 hypothetical protein [Alphaproteobacteria bacterium]